jgi:sulfur carrier protein ThiS
MPLITIHDAQTNKTIVREMTDAENAQYEADQTAIAKLAKLEAKKAKTKADVLAKLGLTADEVAALLS